MGVVRPWPDPLFLGCYYKAKSESAVGYDMVTPTSNVCDCNRLDLVMRRHNLQFGKFSLSDL